MPEDLVECPRCSDVFVPAPGECPECGISVEGTEGPPERDRVSRSRLERIGAAGGVGIAALVTGAGSLFLGRPALGMGLLFLGLAIAGFVLLKR